MQWRHSCVSKDPSVILAAGERERAKLSVDSRKAEHGRATFLYFNQHEILCMSLNLLNLEIMAGYSKTQLE